MAMTVNRAPVLTLWAAVVAERLGVAWDEALTLGRPRLSAQEASMNEAALFEERIDTNRGHSRVTIKVELGGDGAIQVSFQGRDAPTVVYQYSDPDDVLAVGKALVRAADAAGAACGTETG